METMNIALPSPMKKYVLKQVAQGSYSSVSEYVRRLIREEQERKAREETDRQLLEALEGAPSAPWTKEELAELKRRARKRPKRKVK